MTKRILLPVIILFLISSCSKEDERWKTYSGIMDVNTVRVSAQTAGVLTELSCDEGTSVKQGQALARIETERLGYQIDQSKSLIDEIDHQYQVAIAQTNSASLNRDNIKLRYDRFTALLKANSATQQSVDDLKAQFETATEQLRAAKAQLAVIASKRKQVQSGMKATQKQVRDAAIPSPRDGTVLVKYAEVGELVSIGAPICEIANLSEMWTKMYVGEADLHSIKIGQKVQLKVDGLGERTFEGMISWISDKSEFTPKTILTEETRTTLVYPAKVTVKNSDGILKIGMPVSILIERKVQ